MQTIRVFYEIEKDGRVIIRKELDSFVRNFSALLSGIFNNGNVIMKDSNGVNVAVRTSTDFTADRVWLAYGTSNEPVDFDQHKLVSEVAIAKADAIIRQDLGSGERVIASKSFIYTGSQNITVWEIGLYGRFYDVRGRVHFFLLARDILETGLPLAPGEGFTARYIIEIKV